MSTNIKEKTTFFIMKKTIIHKTILSGLALVFTRIAAAIQNKKITQNLLLKSIIHIPEKIFINKASSIGCLIF